MDVNHEVAHLGVIDGRLRRGAPCIISLLVVRIDADHVQFGNILEFVRLRRHDLSSENEMQQLPRFDLVHWGYLPLLGCSGGRMRTMHAEATDGWTTQPWH